MNHTKEEVVNAVLFFARKYKKEENYQAILKSGGSTLPRIVEMIVFDMFINGFIAYYGSDEEFKMNNILSEYAIELKEFGMVEFKKE